MQSSWFDFEQSNAMLTMQGWVDVLEGAKELLWLWKRRTYILRLLITPFPSRAPFKNSSLTVAVYCQAVTGAAPFPCSPLAQCVNVKSVQSVLTALPGPLWSGVFELAAQPLAVLTCPWEPASTSCRSKGKEDQKTGGWYRPHHTELKMCHHL